MNSANFEKELLLAEKLSRDYLSSLKNLPRQCPLLARNLVLDVFAEKRQFIRKFQDVIDTGFSNEPGKHWAKALSTDHDWGFQAAATDVISSFDDRWQSANLLFITRIMQAAGSWCGYLPASSWEQRIEDYKLRMLPINHLDPEIKKHPGFKPINNDIHPAQVVSPKNGPSSKGLAADPHPQSLSSKIMPASGKVSKTQPDSSGLAVAGVGIFLILFVMVVVRAVTKTAEGLNNKQPLVTRASLESRLGSYRDSLSNARLKCELASIESSLRYVAAEASAARQNDLVQQAKGLIAESTSKQRFLDQKGRHNYNEDCSVGVGYQQFDNYTWVNDSDYRSTLFLVAKRECRSPSVIVKTYNHKTNKELYSQIIRFAPSVESGSQNVPFLVPANALPSSGTIRTDITPYKCN